MKDPILGAYIAAARPEGDSIKNAFTDRVMAEVMSGEIFSAAIRKMSVTKRETLFMKIRHLPKIAIVAIAVGALLLLAGTTYAVVRTVSNLSHVKVNKAGTNEFGREQLTVEFDSCDEQKKEGTTYELKRGSNLSLEDGEKVLQAKCDIDIITSWIQNDPQSLEKMGGSDRALFRMVGSLNTADTVKSIQGKKLTLERREKVLPDNVRVVENNKVVPLESVKPGDTVLYFIPAQYGDEYNTEETDGMVIFKLPLPAKYYGIDYRSYVHARSACDGNPERTCLQSNGINHTILTVAHGGTLPVMNDSRAPRTVQGRVVSYDANSIQLDVGRGVIYTIQTPNNIIKYYNQTTVYGLASFDGIYAKTSPEDLKIKFGDNLDIYYLEPASEFSSTLSWNQITTIGLMVERTIKDLDVLQKY